MVEPPADVLGMGMRYSLSLEPVADLEVRDDQRAGALSDGDCITDVVPMSVGDQNVIGLDLVG
jgi:hypothetical protein